VNTRIVWVLVALAAAIGAATASAQQPQQQAVARLIGLEGNVLVSQQDAMVAALNNQRVAVGTRVLTMAGATVTIDYDGGGCGIKLNPNERFTVRVGECAVLAGEVVPLGPAPGAIGGGAVAAIPAGVGSFALGAAAGLAAGLIYRCHEACNCPVSPN